MRVPREPLGFLLEVFAWLHLVANPVDTLVSYLRILADCYRVLLDVRDVKSVPVGRLPDTAGSMYIY